MLQLIFNASLIFALSSCNLFQPRHESADKIIEKASKQRVFFAPYDSVWKAAHLAIKYTIANENQDFGVMETDYIKAVDGWLPPHQSEPQHKSARYKLTLSFAKTTTAGKDSTRVTIEKIIEIFPDFISETKLVPSDGLEEQSIFYRIEREIIIEKALKKASSISQ